MSSENSAGENDHVLKLGRWTRAEGEAAVQAWRASGLNKAAWCREQGIPLHRLHYWSERVGEAAVAEPGFVPVVLGKPESQLDLRVLSGGAVEIRVLANFDAALLRQVVEALQ